MSSAQEAGREPGDALIAAYARTFINRQDLYPYQRQDGSYATVKKPLTRELVRRHLSGQLPTLGAYALNADSNARWVCFDADTDAEWQRLLDMAFRLITGGVRAFLEPSRRGGHLWLFTPDVDGLICIQGIVVSLREFFARCSNRHRKRHFCWCSALLDKQSAAAVMMAIG